MNRFSRFTIPALLVMVVGIVSLALSCDSVSAADWKPVEGQLLTRWAGSVDPDTVWREYPRPQMVRDQWQNLNGLWQYAITSRDADQPQVFDGKILVPFAVESALSGVKKPVQPSQELWYRRRFDAPSRESDDRVLLHFGAVDWKTTVLVNGKEVGQHQGGYDPFSIDVTDALTRTGAQELVVRVWDPTDSSYQPRGKQILNPHGIWYTAVTGIWQTVWLETVPAQSIRALRFVTDVDQSSANLTVDLRGHDLRDQSGGVTTTAKIVSVSLGDDVTKLEKPIVVSGPTSDPLAIRIPNARLWSPDQPWLYQAEVTIQRGQQELDRVSTYFGMRNIVLGKAADGFMRLLLNDKPLFQIGPLDQGWWPDGLYTAPCDEALRYDVEITKEFGFNMIRKHVKVEPARWYYHCDRLGIVVWQDMPSGDKYIGGNDPDFDRSVESEANFRREYNALINTHCNHPSIVAWVPFNEGWGQFKTDEILAWTKQLDPTRLVDGPSGWADRGSGDMNDMHRYPGPGMPEPEERRAVVLGEFGGLGLPIEGHLWWNKRNWGYRSFKNQEDLQRAYTRLIKKLHPMVGAGLAAAVYTQTTDVEGEVNGLMTYDREVIKFDVQKMAKLHAKLHLPPPKITRKPILPTSESKGQTWLFTTQKPDDHWNAVDFDASTWDTGPGGFGREDTPGAKVRTEWTTDDIWTRQEFDLSEATVTELARKPEQGEASGLHLRIHHDEDAVVYLNGKRVVELTGYMTDYEDIDIASAVKSLRPGKNVIAVHCHQTRGGQYIDTGLVDVHESE